MPVTTALFALLMTIAAPAQPPVAVPVAIVAPAVGAPPSSTMAPPPVFEWFDSENFEELKEVKPSTLLKSLRKGRRFAKFETGTQKRPFADGTGRETQLHLYVPKKPTGIVFLLHGLGGGGGQLMPHYEQWAERSGLILAAPSARKLGKVKNEDWSSTAESLQHWWSYRPDGFVLSALSVLKREFPINEDRVYLSGYSMGGFGTWNLGLRYPDRFAAAAPIAGGISQHEYQIERDDKLRALVANASQLPFYIVHGEADQTVSVDHDRKTRAQLQKLGYEHEYREISGAGHILDVRAGSPLMKGIQAWLGDRTRKSHPTTVRFHSLGEYMNQAYWIRIDEYDGGGPGDVTAKIRKNNQITIETKGVKKLTVFIDDTRIKLLRPVVITWNGTEVHKKKVKSSSEAIIESWRAREDRQLLYPAMVTIEIPAEEDTEKKGADE